MRHFQTVQQQEQTLRKHQTFLKKFKKFPAKTRKALYCQLLQLPLNHDNFTELTKQYPMLPEHTMDQQVAFIVGALGCQYPDLAKQWLPGMIYPFVRLFHEDSVASFEISLNFLANFAKPLLSNYPNPSQILMKWFGSHLTKLQSRVNSLEYPLSAVINPTLLVSLTDVLNKEDWLQVFDFLFAHPYQPWYYISLLVEIVKTVEDSLLKLNSVEKIVLALRKEKNIEPKILIAKAVKLAANQLSVLQQIYANTFFPLPKGRYPVLRFTSQKKEPNQLLQRQQDQNIHQLKKKYVTLQSLMEGRIQYGLSADEKEIDQRYEQVDGQMRQYLQQLRQQHAHKIAALKEIQRGFKEKLQTTGNIQHRLARDAIERRGRLEREIQHARRQADSIRQMEVQLMTRIHEIAQIKKQQLLEINKELKRRQYDLK